MSIKVACGPIIGTVTDSSARILLEVESDTYVTIILKNENTNKPLRKFLKAKTPSVFKFEGLEKSTLYNVEFMQKVTYSNESLNEIKSSFKTLSDDFAETKFAFISCNSINKELAIDKNYSLWKNLAESISNYDYVLHGGDQVYLDDGGKNNIYAKVKEMLKDAAPENFGNFDDEVRNLIREEYHKNFNYEYVATVHRNAPNFMIFDDHEIHDNFGFKPVNDTLESKIDTYFAGHARWFYYAYQRQLWSDINLSDFSSITTDFHRMVVNGTALFFMDWRGCRTWNKVEGDSLKLGQAQWDELEKCFGENGEFSQDNVKACLLFTTVPIVLLSKTPLINCVGMKENNIYDQWSHDCPDEQLRLLQLVKGYTERTNKQFALVSGNIHMNGVTDIFHNKKFVYKQFISSGIIQECPTNFQIKMMNMGFDFKEELREGYTYDHRDFSVDNNYGIIEVKSDVMFGGWVRSNIDQQILPYKKENVIFNKQEPSKDRKCCCTIF